MKKKEPTFKPKGDRLPLPELDKIARVTQEDVDRAMALANKELKPYLEAESS